MKLRISLLCLSFIVLRFSSIGQSLVEPISAKALVAKYKAAKGVMVVNFWSTWCKPCIDEIPHFIAITDSLKKENVELLLVSQDTRELNSSGKLKAFMQQKKWNVPAVWLSETDADYYTSVIEPAWSGVIPVTIIINPSKGYYHFYEESLSADVLVQEIKKAMTH